MLWKGLQKGWVFQKGPNIGKGKIRIERTWQGSEVSYPKNKSSDGEGHSIDEHVFQENQPHENISNSKKPKYGERARVW